MKMKDMKRHDAIYDDVNTCAYCGSFHKVLDKCYSNGTLFSAVTKCKYCGHSDTWKRKRYKSSYKRSRGCYSKAGMWFTGRRVNRLQQLWHIVKGRTIKKFIKLTDKDMRK